MNKIVCIGDSLTYGYGVKKEDSWVYLLRQRLIDRYSFINKGVNGDTSSGLLSRFYKDVILNHPEIAIITIGSNDFISLLTKDYVYDNVLLLIKDCLREGIIPVIGIPPFLYPELAKKCWSSSIDYRKINSEIFSYRNKIIDYCIKNNVLFMDFYNCAENLSISISLDSLFIDGLHPMPILHKAMAEKAEKALII